MQTSARIPRNYTEQLKYTLLIPFFFICFIFIYEPFGMKEFYEGVGAHSYHFHFVLLFCILLGTTGIMRLVLWALLKKFEFRWWHYTVWCFGEGLVAACFMAMYTSLFLKDAKPYFSALAYSSEYVVLTLIFPYIFLIMNHLIDLKREELRGRAAPAADSLIKFYDEHRRLKFTIDPGAVVYIEAEANYIKIHYLEGERERVFLLRNSMKSLEESALRHGFVRCHRSYYVNPRYVKLLRREKDSGIEAEMLRPGIDPIPVSKMYYSSLLERL